MGRNIIHLHKWHQQKRAKRKAFCLNYLGGKCVKCNAKEDLEFDHIDPNSVEFRIGCSLEHGMDRLINELDKCQLLCFKCHWAKTRRDRGLCEPSHGTASYYNNYKCRCDKCRSAWTIYAVPRIRGYRQRARSVVA